MFHVEMLFSLWYKILFCFKKPFFCSTFLYNFYYDTFFVASGADTFVCGSIPVEIDSRIDITALKGYTYELFYLHCILPHHRCCKNYRSMLYFARKLGKNVC